MSDFTTQTVEDISESAAETWDEVVETTSEIKDEAVELAGEAADATVEFVTEDVSEFVTEDVPEWIAENESTINVQYLRGSLAHELTGHREAAIAGRTQSLTSWEEAQASIRAARFAPGLTSIERTTLLRDGVNRLRNDGFRVRDVRDALYIDTK